MTIDLVARRQELVKDVEKIGGDIRNMQASVEEMQVRIQQAEQTRQRLVGGLLMLDELMKAPDVPPASGDNGADA
jgi:uncharacterized protein (DUF2126 family)